MIVKPGHGWLLISSIYKEKILKLILKLQMLITSTNKVELLNLCKFLNEGLKHYT